MPTVYRPGQRIDHYEIIRQLGQGGASRAYLVLDRNTSQEVVLKFPIDDLLGGSAIFERYNREAEIGQFLDSPLIQHHLNKGEERSENYLVLEYMRGKTLRTAMKERAPALLEKEAILHIIVQVCKALIYLHTHGVIHQDIKPDNIFLLDNGDVKLFDFGIATFVAKERGRWRLFPQLVGTPDYMAPERLQGKVGAVRSDLYAVGIVLYELCCGRTPFQETDGFAIVSQQISHDPPDILHFNPALDCTLATLIMHVIRRNPAKRYASMQEMLDDLCQLDNVLPVDYVPDAPLLGGRYRQAIRLALITLILCLGLVAFGLFTQFAHHAVR